MAIQKTLQTNKQKNARSVAYQLPCVSVHEQQNLPVDNVSTQKWIYVFNRILASVRPVYGPSAVIADQVFARSAFV